MRSLVNGSTKNLGMRWVTVLALLAWVLWVERGLANWGPTTWDASNAFEARDQCQAAIDVVIARANDEATRGVRVDGTRVWTQEQTVFIFDTKTTRLNWNEWKCLPDTIDPRPKQ